MAGSEEFRLQMEASRRFTHVIDGITFTLRLPVPQAWRRAVMLNRDSHGEVMTYLTARQLLDEALVDWAGLTQRHFDVKADPSPIPFSEAWRSFFLDWRTDLADGLSRVLAEKREAWMAQFEADEKNLPPASNGT